MTDVWLTSKRLAAGFPRQEDLAQALDVPQQTVSRWESGGRPRVEKMRALAEALRIPLDELFEHYELPTEKRTTSPVDLLDDLQSRIQILEDRQAELVEMLEEARRPKRRARRPAKPEAKG